MQDASYAINAQYMLVNIFSVLQHLQKFSELNIRLFWK